MPGFHPSTKLSAGLSLTASLLLACAAATASQDPLEEVRAAFRQAYEQVDRTAPGSQPSDSESLRGYPLYPYLEAARIRRALAEATASAPADRDAAAFIAAHEGEPLAEELRRTWLASLAQRKLWAAFLENDREEVREDSARCQALEARIELGNTAGLTPRIIERWRIPRSQPDCERAFEWLRGRSELTPALIEERARAALSAGNVAFARQIIQQLPGDRSAPLLQWLALLEYPQREIDALIAVPEKPVEPQALLAGWSSLARQDRDAAARRLDRLIEARRLTPAAASPFVLALALPLAWDRRAREALEYFGRVAPADMDDRALEWQTRAALWAQDWRTAAAAIAAMPASQRELARWRYWAARTAESLGDQKRAAELYRSVLADDNFYSGMAAARLDQKLTPHQETLPADETELARVEQLPAFVRARELLRNGMRPPANAEWSYGLKPLAGSSRQQAIHLASRWGWHDQAIATAAQQRVFNDYALLYPRPFELEVDAAARLSRLTPDFIYAVMRQESLYRSDAVSSAGARGLLQMQLETARRTARDWKMPRPQAQDLLDPAIGVRLGAAHLRTLIDRFGGQRVIALAAYNAGPNAAARWRSTQTMDADVWIENIPYNETRAYVQRILWHGLVFAWLRTGKAQSTTEWLVRLE